MNRQVVLLTAIGSVLALVLFFLFGWKPKSEEIAQINDEIEQTIAQQATLQGRIESLHEVRAAAPAIEADLTAAESIIPSEAALPSTLRQLQLAADDAGVDLVSVSAGRPTASNAEQAPGLAELTLSIQMNGTYFQTVDLLRRIEDPSITPRGMMWTAVALAPADYPELSVSLSGKMFAALPGAPAEAEQASAPDGAGEATEPADQASEPADASTEDAGTSTGEDGQ